LHGTASHAPRLLVTGTTTFTLWRDQQTLTVEFSGDGVGVGIRHDAGQRRGPHEL